MRFLLGLLCALPFPAAAELWITSGFWSEHFSEESYRENNTGIGVQTEDWTFGTYMNSVDKRSWYGMYLWKPAKYEGFFAGAGLGLLTGYAHLVPIAPAIGWSGRRLGLDVIAAPKLPEVAPFIAIRLRVRIN